MSKIEKTKLPNIKNIILVASGKGGVGKSTVAAGLALSLAKQGFATGLLDADIYGPSVPLLFDLEGRAPIIKKVGEKSYLIPFVKKGVKLMSLGFLVNKAEAVVWRGPRASSGVQQLLSDSYWGNLDYLIVDTPPGTGDIHITLLQNYTIGGVIVVSTPQQMALSDVKKAIHLYKDQNVGAPILGVVENMAWFTPSAHPDEKYFVFGKGGGQLLADEFEIPLLSQIPINEKLCELCDGGKLDELLDESVIQASFDKLAMSIDLKLGIEKMKSLAL